ncbi:MAG: protein phosphatase CheZ [Burkholderiaceae bacterium]|nr:protein phosphatase CheZ [Burkholderiaceae bacterium]
MHTAIRSRDPAPTCDEDPVYRRIGEITRELHDAIRAIDDDRQGHDESCMPAHERPGAAPLETFGRDAASRVRGEIDLARAEQAELARIAARVGQTLSDNTSASLREQGVRDLVAAVATVCERTAARLGEIARAHPNHDRREQAHRRLVELISRFEDRMLRVLVEAAPGELRRSGELSAPAAPATGVRPQGDATRARDQVDELLDELGF